VGEEKRVVGEEKLIVGEGNGGAGEEKKGMGDEKKHKKRLAFEKNAYLCTIIYIAVMKPSRFAIIRGFVLFFWIASFLVRTALLLWAWPKAGLGAGDVAVVYGKGFVFDTAVALFACLPLVLGLFFVPQRWFVKRGCRWAVSGVFFFMLVVVMFAFFAEFPFWEEYENRFNFIAVDYLVYTYEVVNNIHQSYPLPLLVGGMILVTALVVVIFRRLGLFRQTFCSETRWPKRLVIAGSLAVAGLGFAVFLSNEWAETSGNRYRNELSKAGIFSFFAAFKNNELDYYAFYPTRGEKELFDDLRAELAEGDVRYLREAEDIRRWVGGVDSGGEVRPNVILVVIESLSADFMGFFGSDEDLTPCMDSLAQSSLVFTEMYATGTRTVRGMEALALCVPPTPGHSIVRRPGNQGLYTVGKVFADRGYSSVFIYGGDGYFDNMNAFFGNNRFDIIDHGRRLNVSEPLAGQRKTIPREAIRFENAWGICDEDLYEAAIRDADEKFGQGRPFFQFIMTTSNHRPYTYPEGTIDIPSGTGRAGAVKYTDYAVGQFVRQIRQKAWFENTVVVLVADHCASSAGRNEINVGKYHIPCLVLNLHGNCPERIGQQCSQIDLFPTLFACLGWTYESRFFGRNVLAEGYRPRAFVGTYQKLGYLEGDRLVVLSPRQPPSTYRTDGSRAELTAIEADTLLVNRAVMYYQAASRLFGSGGLRE
jgi:phosphoglycerol transferase MdoB-like AlkP superfamily enzyme